MSATTSSAAPARSESSTPRGPTQSGPGRSARAPRRRCGVFGVKGNARWQPSTAIPARGSRGTTPASRWTSGRPSTCRPAPSSASSSSARRTLFLSTDRGQFLYWVDSALGSLNWATLPVGAYTGTRLAAWISSNYAAATYVAETNEIQIAYDGNRRVLNDSELRDQFPGTGSYPPGASASKPLSINHLLGPSFIDGALQIHNFVVMNPYSELYLRCSTLANAAEIKGPLGSDIICKLIVDKGVGFIMQTRTDEGHYVRLHGPITLRYLRFKLTDVDGNVVNTRGTSVSFALFLDTEA